MGWHLKDLHQGGITSWWLGATDSHIIAGQLYELGIYGKIRRCVLTHKAPRDTMVMP